MDEKSASVSVLRRGDIAVLAAITAFAVFFRLATLMMIHTGVDERDYWTSAKALAFGLDYPELTHRTVRFGVILPVAAAQRVLGESPNVYYVLPILNAALQAALAYLVGRRVRGRACGFLAALMLILFPYMIRAGSQVRPEIFSVTYLLAALLCFLAYLESKSDRRRAGGLGALAGSAVLLFAAYEATVTNLFFAPGLLVVMLARRRPLREIALFVGVLAALVAAETALYAALTPFKLGQLQVIAHSHLEDNAKLGAIGFFDLFQRYARPYLQLYWQVPFAAFAAAAAWFLFRRGRGDVGVPAAAALSFFICLTFAVKGVRPIMPAEPFINRYFTAVLAPVAVVLAAAVVDLGREVRRRFKWRIAATPASLVGLTLVCAVAIMAFFSSSLLPRAMQVYAHSVFGLSSHPLLLTGVYRARVDRAWDEGEPIVAADDIAGEGAITACRAFFLSLSRHTGGTAPQIDSVSIRGTTCLVLARRPNPGFAPAFLAVVREPFRLRQIEPGSIARLQGEAFPG